MPALPALSEWFTRDTLAVLGDVLSVVSFVLSVFVLWNIRKLRSVYKLRARGPSLIRDLSKSASNLSNYLNDYADSIPQIEEELSRAGVKLRSLESKIGRRLKVSVRHTRKFVDQCRPNAENEADVRSVYIRLITVTEELKEHQKDLDWEA